MTTLTKEQMAICATAGFTASQMLRAGFTASQMLRAGFTASQMLDAGFTASEMLDAGFTASEMLDAGFTASEMLDAGFTASQMLRAGFTASQMLRAGCTASQMLRAGFTASQMLDAETPLLQKPYTALLAAINANERKFQQSTFGPDNSPSQDYICKTAMCTAGHLVSMAGAQGQALKDKLGFAQAAALIHAKAHPDYPCQNFGSIPDAWGLAYIEMMAGVEAKADAQ
jgi:hypothetical protein